MAWAAIVQMIKQGISDTANGIAKPAEEWADTKAKTIAAENGGTVASTPSSSAKKDSGGGGLNLGSIGDLLGKAGSSGGGEAAGSAASGAGSALSSLGGSGGSGISSLISSLSDENAKENVQTSNEEDNSAELKAAAEAALQRQEDAAAAAKAKEQETIRQEATATASADPARKTSSPTAGSQAGLSESRAAQPAQSSGMTDQQAKDFHKTTSTIRSVAEGVAKPFQGYTSAKLGQAPKFDAGTNVDKNTVLDTLAGIQEAQKDTATSDVNMKQNIQPSYTKMRYLVRQMRGK